MNTQETEQLGHVASYGIERRLFAEFMGTFALTFVAAGAGVIGAISGQVGSVAAAVAPGLLVMVMIYTIGPISGAHVNPAVTLAFALRQNFPWRRVPGYWGVQLAGAVLAALLLRWLFGLAGHVGATLPHFGDLQSLVMETILTFLLVTVILAVAANHQIVGSNAALGVGATIVLDGLFALPISGASMNPARSFGPALVAGQLGTYWIYVIGPIAGSLLAVGAACLLRGPGSPEADRVATGEES
ncbi:MAG: aquaporin [Chloroflexota bacterium]|nr:aquaporin [Chloroflexota bacterium]